LPRNPRGVLAALLTRTPPGRRVASRYLGVSIAPRWTSPEPPVALARRVRVPFAIVHGEGDSFIPASTARELHAAAHEPKLVDVVPALGHALQPEAVLPVVDAVEWTLQCAAASA
jgi:pimeloyl-ACP methyl ester carboxylesterase